MCNKLGELMTDLNDRIMSILYYYCIIVGNIVNMFNIKAAIIILVR